MRRANILCPIKYMGGKSRMVPALLRLIPPHTCYCEPFGGAGRLLLAKPRSKVEVWNDLDSSLANFFLCCQQDVGRVLAELEWLPYSQELYNRWKREPLPEEPFAKAARWFYLVRNAFGGDFRHGWSTSPHKSSAQHYVSAKAALRQFAQRLEGVHIGHEDFEACIRRWDSKDTCFYIDSPYMELNDYYGPSFTEPDHKRLAQVLHQIQGKAMVSYYPHTLVEELYEGWQRLEWEGFVSADKGNGKARSRSVEWILTNWADTDTML